VGIGELALRQRARFDLLGVTQLLKLLSDSTD